MAASSTEKNTSPTANRLMKRILQMSEKQQRTLLRVLEKRFAQGRRRHERKRFSTIVDFTTLGRTHRDFIQNISAGGVYIRTRMPLSVGQELLMTFSLPRYEQHVKVLGEVVRVNSNGVGVKFKPGDENQERIIKATLQKI